MANNLQVVIDIQSKLQGFTEANAQMKVLVAETEKLNASGASVLTGALKEVEVQAAAAGVAIGKAGQRIIDTNALPAGFDTGESARAVALRAELDARVAARQAAASLIPIQQESLALTVAEGEAMAVAAKQTEGAAAASLLNGANLNKAKGEAIVLGREIATGSVNARTLGALLGSLGNTITIAALAGYELYQVVAHAGDAALELAKDGEKMAENIHKAVGEWTTLATRAQDFADEVKLADKVKLELDRVSVEMAAFRAKELPLWQKFWDAIITQQGNIFDTSGPLAKSPASNPTFQADLEKEKLEAQERYNQAVLDANLSIDLAKQKTAEWAAAEANLPQGLADYSQRLSEAQAKLEDLDARRRANMTDPGVLAAYNDQIAVVNDLKGKVNQLGDELDKANKKPKEGRTEIVAYGREVSSTLQAIRQQQQLINQNPFLTIDQKNALLLPLIREEIAKLNEEVLRGQALLKGGTLDPATYEQVAQKVQQARFEIELLAQKTQTLNFAGGLRENLTSWVSSFGTAAQQVGQAITGSINTALDATSQALSGMIFRTGNWRQTMLQAEQSIVGSLIKIGLQMLFNATIGKLITRQNAQDQTAANAQITASAAPAAAATSISSFGTSAVVGAVAAAAAIALIIGLLAGGFEGGGHTGFGGTKRIAGVVHGNEFVQPDPSVRYYGLDVHEAMRQRRIPASAIQALLGNYRYPVTPRLGSFEVGGAVAAVQDSSNNDGNANSGANGSSGQTKLVHNQALFLDLDEARKWILRQPEGEREIIDLIRGNKHIIGGFKS